jgi:hypothetical protein
MQELRCERSHKSEIANRERRTRRYSPERGTSGFNTRSSSSARAIRFQQTR